jgi:hypothetical protein
MTDSRTPIQSQLARFLVGGARQKRGYVLLHPDRLTAVVSPADIVGYLGGPMVFVGFASPLFHVIGWLGVAIGALIGRQAGDAYNKLQAIRRAAAGEDGMTVIPLDLITGVRTTKSQGFGGLWETQTLVGTTADGTEYGFHGKMAGWQTDLASALAARGRDVRATPQGITVTCPGSGCVPRTE